jgi:hypothetical protein
MNPWSKARKMFPRRKQLVLAFYLFANDVETFFVDLWGYLVVVLIHSLVFAYVSTTFDLLLCRKKFFNQIEVPKMFRANEKNTPITIRAYNEAGKDLTFKFISYMRFFRGYAKKKYLSEVDPAVYTKHFCHVLNEPRILLVFSGKMSSGSVVLNRDGKITKSSKITIGVDRIEEDSDLDSDDDQSGFDSDGELIACGDILVLDEVKFVWN